MCAVEVVPPSVFLPPLKLLKACSDKEISHAIASLRHIYLPEVRGSSRRRNTRSAGAEATHVLRSHLTLDTFNVKAKPESSGLSAIRADPFERTFAIQWLTRFVSLFSEVVADSPGFLTVSSQALEEAASLLAVCAGSAASGTVTRTFTFPLSRGTVRGSAGSPDVTSAGREENNGISVVLRDAPLESSDFSSVGAQTWGGSCILAEMIAESPQNFSICAREEEDVEPSLQWHHADAPFRALELGAGTGLASLVLGKVLGRVRGSQHRQFRGRGSANSRRAVDTVVATDFHPSVLSNLGLNFAVNFPPQLCSPQSDVGGDRTLRSSETLDMVPTMVVLPLDWSVIHSLAHPSSSPWIGSSSTFPEIDDERADQTFTPNEDTTTVLHQDAFRIPTSFQSQAQAKGLDPTEIISGQRFSDENTDTQTAAASPCSAAPQLDIPFDLIIGADIIYEHSHARWVRTCVERFLRKPTRPQLDHPHIPLSAYSPRASSPLLTDRRPPMTPTFHLVIPLRHTHAVECHSVEEVFSQAADIISSRQLGPEAAVPPQSSSISGTGDHTGIPRHTDGCVVSSAGRVADFVPFELAIIGQEDIWCDAYSDCEEGDVVYRYYRIGWV